MTAVKARLLLLLVVAVSSCRQGATARPVTPVSVAEPRWQSLLEPLPDLLLVVRPRALRQDTLYGPLLRRAIELARAHAKIVTSATALDAVESADEVIVAVRDLSKGDFVVVVRGVPAEVDPASLVDETGRPLWTATSGGPVRELSRAPKRAGADDEDGGASLDASLFELPGRTWVIATGSASAWARTNWSRETKPGVGGPTGLAGLDSALDPQAVAILRLSGPALVQRFRALRPPGLLAPVGHELETITVVLSAGRDALIRATFSYNSATAVMSAEARMRETISALSVAKAQTFAWLHAAHTQTSRCCVILVTPLPAALLEAIRTDHGGG